ncbi:MAG: disulfide bond formation protein B [Candidatus Kerfeldbacteria bacterium]|nr:disulfide bond formation protein B [Candidatus Kerfeldbacteria bacterium]
MNKKYYLYFAWAVAIVATLSSLYLGEVLGLTPCTLCWYQRLAMWPLVLLLGLAVYRQDSSLVIASLILSAIGLIIAIYQNWLYFNVIPDSLASCAPGAPCSEHLIKLFGFLDIPQLSLVAFILMFVSLVVYFRAK